MYWCLPPPTVLAVSPRLCASVPVLILMHATRLGHGASTRMYKLVMVPLFIVLIETRNEGAHTPSRAYQSLWVVYVHGNRMDALKSLRRTSFVRGLLPFTVYSSEKGRLRAFGTKANILMVLHSR